MHNIAFDTVNKTADFNINDQEEVDLIIRGIGELITKQELKTVQRGSKDPISQIEVDKLERFKALREHIKIGPVRMTAQEMFDLENAINEGIVKYEKEVTDNPLDDTITTMKSFKNMIHNVLRTDVLKR